MNWQKIKILLTLLVSWIRLHHLLEIHYYIPSYCKCLEKL